MYSFILFLINNCLSSLTCSLSFFYLVFKEFFKTMDSKWTNFKNSLVWFVVNVVCRFRLTYSLSILYFLLLIYKLSSVESTSRFSSKISVSININLVVIIFSIILNYILFEIKTCANIKLALSLELLDIILNWFVNFFRIPF